MNGTRINNSNITKNVSQNEQKKYGYTGVYKLSPKLYGSNTQYQPSTHIKNLHKYLEEQTQNSNGEKYVSPNNEITNQGYFQRYENSGTVTKGNQNLNNYEENWISQVNNKNHVSDIEILESQNYQENQVINLNSAGRRNYVEINADKRQLKENKNNLEQSDSISHNHGVIHNVPLNHNLVPNKRTPVPVSKTATYSINYLYPMDGYNVKNVGSNLFLYKGNNNEHNTHYQSPEDEEIGESDLHHQPNHSDGSVADWEIKLTNDRFKYTAPNEKEIDVGKQTFNKDESLEVASVEGGDERKLIKAVEDFYTKALHIKEKDISNTEKGFAPQITIKGDEKFDISQLKNEISSFQTKEGIQSSRINFYEDNSDYATRDNLEVKEYNNKNYENAVDLRSYQNYKYMDTDFIRNGLSEIPFYANYNNDDDTESIGHSVDKYISDEGSKNTISNENSIISNDDADIEDGNYEYIPKQIAGIVDSEDNNSGYDHYEYIQQNDKHYSNAYNNGGYKDYKQYEYIAKDESESPEYYNNVETTGHRKLFEETISKDGSERISKLTENNQYSSKYYSDDYSPKIYAHIAEPESEFDYISESGTLYDGYDKNKLVSKYDSKLTASDESYYISKNDKDTSKYHAYENIPEIEGDKDVVKDYKTYEYFAKDGEEYKGYEYVARDGSEYGVLDKNEYILDTKADIGEFDKIYVSKYDAEFEEYNSNPKHYAPFEASDGNDYILKDNANDLQYKPSQYVTSEELKYDNHEQYKHTLKTNDETEYQKYINGVAIKEYESIVEDSYARDVTNDGSYINDMQANDDVTKVENEKYFSRDVILENDWTEVDGSLKGEKVIYDNPAITAGSEIRLPIKLEKHYIFNEPHYSENDHKYASQIGEEKDISYGDYVDMQDQHYQNVHLKDWPLSSFAEKEDKIIISEYNNEDSTTIRGKGAYNTNLLGHKYINTKNENIVKGYLLSEIDDNVQDFDSQYGNKNTLAYSDDSEALNEDKLLEQEDEKLSSGIIEDINNSNEPEDIKYHREEEKNYFPRYGKLGIYFDNDEIINKNDKTVSVLNLTPSNIEADSYTRDSFTHGTTNSEEHTNYSLESEELKLNNLKDGLTYGTASYLPQIYESRKNSYQSYDSDFNIKSEEQDLLYSQKQYLPQKEIPFETFVDSQELYIKDSDHNLRNWPVSIYKFDSKHFLSLQEEELAKNDDEIFVETNIKEPYRTLIIPYSETNLKGELEVESYGEKGVLLENSDEEIQNSDEISEFTHEVSRNVKNKKLYRNSYLSDVNDSFEPIGLVVSQPQKEMAYKYSNNLKDIKYEVTDHYKPSYENLDIYRSNPSKLVFNDIKYSYPKLLPYHTNTNYDIKENYEGGDQIPYVISETLKTPFLVDVNKEYQENEKYFAPKTKCSHDVNGHLKFSRQHNSDKKSSLNCLETEFKYNPLDIDNINGKFYYETLKKPTVISVGAHLSLNSLDSFKIKHRTIHLDSDPVPVTKLNEYYSAEDLDEINSEEVIKCKPSYNRKSPFPKNHKVKQFSPIPTFPIKNNYEMSLSPIKQSKLKYSPCATFPFISNSRLIRSSEIVSASPDSNISQSSLS